MDGDDDFMSDGMESEPESIVEDHSDEGDQGICVDDDPRGSRDGSDDWIPEVLTPDQIVAYMCEIIRDVSNIINIPVTTTRILLNHFKWDREKLMEIYYDGDRDRLYREAHIVRQSSSSSSVNNQKSVILSSSNLPSRSVPIEENCQICFLTISSHLMSGLECGHRFCKTCWVEYLTTKIMHEGMGQTIACPAHKCDIVVDDKTVIDIIEDKKVRMRYQQLITNGFVECNRRLAWCPFPNCNNAIRVPSVEFRPVVCKCGYCFCFICGQDWHDPILCRFLKLWIQKCNDDSETSNWIAANTKECPKCRVTIEKNGGCNHMICKSEACKYEFCWVCLGAWSSHGSSWYNCNRYDDAASRDARSAQERSRAALQRYLFYYNRYANHMQSMHLENKLYQQVKEKMEEMQQHNMSWIEVQFLRKAVDVLCGCRRTLMYTYSFAYYLIKNNQVVIFEDNQRDMENATETLSGYLERELTLDNVAEIKQKVQDKYRYCENRRKVLLDHCHEGHEKDWWHFAENGDPIEQPSTSWG